MEGCGDCAEKGGEGCQDEAVRRLGGKLKGIVMLMLTYHHLGLIVKRAEIGS